MQLKQFFYAFSLLIVGPLVAAAPASTSLEKRANWATIKWCDNWDLGGECNSLGISTVNSPHVYVGDHWNDRISSLIVTSSGVKCVFFSDYDWNSHQCTGWASINAYPNVKWNFHEDFLNDKLSCVYCVST